MENANHISTSPKWLRARIAVLNILRSDLAKELKQKPRNKVIAHNLKLLSNGVFPIHLDEKKLISEHLFSTVETPISFSELCSYSTYFELHPHKVCGTQEFTSSRDFPVIIKGTRDLVQNTIQKPSNKDLLQSAIELEHLLQKL